MTWPLLGKIDAELVRGARAARKGGERVGPGVITGVADDDPSGISTYTVVAATHG